MDWFHPYSIESAKFRATSMTSAGPLLFAPEADKTNGTFCGVDKTNGSFCREGEKAVRFGGIRGEIRAMTGSGDLPRRIGFWGGSAIMVGIIIGSGIFRSPLFISRELAHPPGVLALWAAGGILSLFGALAIAELGAMLPRSGGLYVYLNEGFGPRIAFVFGWTYLLLIKPLAAAGISLVFAEHLNALLGTHWSPPAVTCVMILALTVLNTVTLRGSSAGAVGLTALRVLALAMIVGLGVILHKGSVANFAPAPAKPFWAALAPVMYAILWTYDGWVDVAAIAGEIEEPHHRIPKILLVGTAATLLIYLAVNAVYFSLLPQAELQALAKDDAATVAPVVMERLLGRAGSVVVTLIIVVSTLGASHGAILTGARVTFAQAQDGLLFEFLGRVHPRFKTPAVSLWTQALLCCAAVIGFKKFEKVTEGYGFLMWIFYALAAGAVLVLRRKKPGLERPYRCWGYPWVPIVFILVAVSMTLLDILRDPRSTLPWLGVLLLGVPFYSIWNRLHRSKG